MIEMDNPQTTFILVTCFEDKKDEAIKHLQKIKGINEINLTKGPYDIILKIKTNTSSELKHMLNQKIRSLDSIRYTMTLKTIE